jgi:hypothetical protein
MLLSVLFAVVLGQAQVAAAPTPVPNPKPDLSALAYFNGTWTCHQTVRGKDRPDTSTTTMEMNDRWLKVHDVAPPFDQYRTAPVNSDTYYTYDPSVKKYVGVELDDFGGYGLSSSPGWTGNTMVWTDKSALDGSVGVTTVTKVSDSEYNFTNTGTDAKGKAVPTTNGTCKKGG